MVWLSAEADTRSFTAARAKLLASATAMKARNSVCSLPRIMSKFVRDSFR